MLRIMTMVNPNHIDQIANRVELLLVRYNDLQQANASLTEQVQALTQERDILKSRLFAARARIDALLARLPQESASALASTETTQHDETN
ncbi:MAG: cell division protein ZapB [Pseudomonadota bacterium]|jgi:cell division septum initiation protein DivIVA